jgi:hypothetical protein
MARKKKLGKYVVRMRRGNATVIVHGRSKAAARANASRFITKHLKNVKRVKPKRKRR